MELAPTQKMSSGRATLENQGALFHKIHLPLRLLLSLGGLYGDCTGADQRV
jgi:hypothetical protein